jgi:hypothetical protein
MVLVGRQGATIHRIEGGVTCAIVTDFEAAFRFGPCELKKAIPDWYVGSCIRHEHYLREERSRTINRRNSCFFGIVSSIFSFLPVL